MAGYDDIALDEEFAQAPMRGTLMRRIFSYLRPYRQTFFLNLFLTLLATASGLAGPKLIQMGIDRFLTGDPEPARAILGIRVVSAIYLGNLLFGWALSVAQSQSAIRIGQGAMNDLRLNVFEHIQRLSLNYFDKTHQGRIIARADSDVDALDRLLTWAASQFLSSAITLVGVLILMMRYDLPLTLAVGAILPPLGIATYWFHKKGRQAYRRLRGTTTRLTSSMAENISGVRVVQSFARETTNLKRFVDLHNDFIERWIGSARIFHTYMPAVNLMAGTATGVVLAYGGWRIIHDRLSLGGLAAFILYLGMFFGPIQTMGDLYNAVLSAAASAERIFNLLDTPPQVRDRPNAPELPALRGDVEFKQVGFRYDTTPEGQWVLQDITFRIPAGSTVALVGHTGSGKSSIISLLARFYEPQQGEIRIDGYMTGEHTLDSLHRQLGIVTQENFLFTGTILDNLRFGRPEATDDEVHAAARRLGTHAILERFPEGYLTRVGERGGSLSAGERQLITITRAMVAEPRILILDEATSAVDPQTEQVIQHALEALFEKRTSVVIAHRLSTVRHADLILVLDHGRIVERGTHTELLELGGTYARLHAEFISQSG